MEEIKVNLHIENTEDGYILFVESKGKQAIINLGVHEGIVGEILKETTEQQHIFDMCHECGSYAYHNPDCSQSLLSKHRLSKKNTLHD